MKKTTAVSGMMTPPQTAATSGSRLPLWLQVAQWCLGRQVPVNRRAIAQAFAIPQRQAADIMLYITGRRSDVVQARRRVTVMTGGMREATLEVLSIREEALPVRGAAAHQAPRQRRGEVMAADALRDLALGRRRPGGAA